MALTTAEIVLISVLSGLFVLAMFYFLIYKKNYSTTGEHRFKMFEGGSGMQGNGYTMNTMDPTGFTAKLDSELGGEMGSSMNYNGLF